MPRENIVTVAVEDHLKAIYQLHRDGEGASTQKIAARLGISASAVTQMLRHLARHQLAHHTPYQPVRLTTKGEKIALELIRHHRLIELYLMESLGYGWEQVHDEAERLEHHISEEFESSIERLLGFPAFDPHGEPIPSRDGFIPPPVTETLESQAIGAHLVVCRVTDEDATLLLYMAERGLRPGTEVHVLGREPFGGSLHLRAAGTEQRVSLQAARNVFVQPAVLAAAREETVIAT